MIYECSVHPDLPRFPHTLSCPQGGMEEHKEMFLQGESAWNSKPTWKLLPRQSLKLKSLKTAQYWNHGEPSAERIMATEVQSDRRFILASSGKKKMKKIWLISFPAVFSIRVSGHLDLKAQQWWFTLWYVVVSISSMAMPHICHLWHATTLFKKAAKRLATKSLFLITFSQGLGSLDWFAAGWPWRAVQIFKFLTWEDPGGLLWLDAKLLLHRRKDLQSQRDDM